MNLKDILSISGYPDLYKLVAQARSGIIVESVVTGKRMQAFASSRISSLEDIAIYTEDGEVPLKELFINIFNKEEGKQTIKHSASSKELKNLFAEALPNYDKERVYVSDMKRIIKWYNLFIEKTLMTQEDVDKYIEEKEKEEAKDEKKDDSNENKETVEKDEKKEDSNENKETVEKDEKKEDSNENKETVEKEVKSETKKEDTN